jgi:hypothetical protein
MTAMEALDKELARLHAGNATYGGGRDMSDWAKSQVAVIVEVLCGIAKTQTVSNVYIPETDDEPEVE